MIRNDPITMVAGDDLTLAFEIRGPDGLPVNIAAATVMWRAARLRRDSAAPAEPVTLSVAGQISNAPAGRVDVALTPAHTRALEGQLLYQLEVTLAGLVTTVAQGTLIVVPRVAPSV